MLTLRELSIKIGYSVSTIRNRMNDTEGIKELFEQVSFDDKKGKIHYRLVIKEENIEKYQEIIKRRKKEKGIKISETIMDCYNNRFNCEYCINKRYCPEDKPLQKLVLELIEKGILKRWNY